MSEKGDGGPAFPTGTQVAQNTATGETVVHQYLSDGISVRDCFAAHAPAQRTDFTAAGAAAVVGREMPDYPGNDASEQARIDHQIATAQFRIDLDVALRLRWADSMLKARKS